MLLWMAVEAEKIAAMLNILFKWYHRLKRYI